MNILDKIEEILHDIEDAREVIANNVAFEYLDFQTWRKPKTGVNAISYIMLGYSVRAEQLTNEENE